MRVLELNVSPKFALMKQVVLNVKRLNPHCLPVVAISTKAFDMQISSDESTKNNKHFVSCFLTNLDIQSLHLEQTRIINLVPHRVGK